MSRQKYIELCKEENLKVLVPGKSIIQYIRKGKPEFAPVDLSKPLSLRRKKTYQPPAVGVMVAYRGEDNTVRIGYSLCNTSMDKFDKHIGLRKAIERAVDGNTACEDKWVDDMPQSVMKPLVKFIGRAQRFFKE